MSKLDHPAFRDDDAAREYLEGIRWPDGPVCPHCGERDRIYKVRSKTVRPGVYKCGHKACRKQFTVTVGTLFERSKVPLHKWVQATFLLCSSKKGISSHQLHRILGVTYQTAWFMTHRLREAMREGDLFTPPTPMGGAGQTVQADETYFGQQANPQPSPQRKGRPYKQKKRGIGGKRAVFALVSGGQARTFHLQRATAQNVRDKLVTNVSRDTVLWTDESNLYPKVGKEFAGHSAVRHVANEYVGKDGATTNAVENYFSIFKRGMKGTYQHCSEKHLHRYLAEFDFRYNHRSGYGINDMDRTVSALANIEGRRLTYRHSLTAA